jgi:hypothetical protein
MSNKNVDTTKSKNGLNESILSVSELAKKMGIQPKRLRSFLRAEYPRDIKGKKWEINSTLAKKIEKDYKAKIKAKEEVKSTKEPLPEKEAVTQNTSTPLESQPTVETIN